MTDNNVQLLCHLHELVRTTEQTQADPQDLAITVSSCTICHFLNWKKIKEDPTFD